MSDEEIARLKTAVEFGLHVFWVSDQAPNPGPGFEFKTYITVHDRVTGVGECDGEPCAFLEHGRRVALWSSEMSEFVAYPPPLCLKIPE